MATARRIRNSWGPRAGVWFDGGAVAGDYTNFPSIVCARQAVPGKWCLLQVHPLNPPLKGKTFEQSKAFILAEIKRAKSWAFAGAIFDLENQLWSVAAIEWIGAQCRAAGVLAYGAPKATLDPGGKKLLGGDIRKNAALLDANFHGLMLWSFGSHTVHLAAAKRLYDAGYNGEIALAHDLWRNNADYRGLTEGPKLMSACLRLGIPAIVFQPQYAQAAARAQLARFLDVPAPTPSGPLYSATDRSITLRADFAAVVGKLDALVTINEKSPGKATSKAIACTRTGNTWFLPAALASYPTGNRQNTYRISLSGTPPAGVTYHTSISQTFIRTTDIAQGAGKTYPPTTRS